MVVHKLGLEKNWQGKEQEEKSLQGEGSAWIKVQTEQVWLLRTL